MVYNLKQPYRIITFEDVPYGKTFRYKMRWCVKTGRYEYLENDSNFITVSRTNFKVAVIKSDIIFNKIVTSDVTH